MSIDSNRSGDRSTIARMLWPCVLVPLFVRSTTAFDVSSALPSLEAFDSPVWNMESNNLFFIGTSLNTVWRYVPSPEDYSSVKIDNNKPVTFVVLANGTNRFAIGTDTSVSVFEWNGQSNQKINPPDDIKLNTKPGETVVTGTVDPKGRLYVGTNLGNVYSVLADNTVTERLSGIGEPGGIAFSVHGTKIYFTDTDNMAIVQHEFHMDSGAIDAIGTTVFDFSANHVPGIPAGIAIDTGGNAFVACSGTNHVVKVATNSGTMLTSYDFYDSNVTGVAFGGPQLDVVYVTTFTTGTLPNSGGSLFRVTETGSKGLPPTSFSFGSPS